MADQEQKEALALIKYFWLITEDNYVKLREIKGCETLSDLPATVTDGVHIMELCESLGIPEENRVI